MMSSISQLAAHHSVACGVAALVICLAAGWLLAQLLHRVANTVGGARHGWFVGAALVAGLGVWTTHFMAMIGYRPDLPLNYGAGLTLASALIGIMAVGVLLAGTAVIRSTPGRLAYGALAGLGIGAMHFTGMNALEGCLQVMDTGIALAACLVGAICLSGHLGMTGFAARGLIVIGSPKSGDAGYRRGLWRRRGVRQERNVYGRV